MNQNYDRLPLLDFLRGFALLGILISNIPIFSAPFYSESAFVDLSANITKGIYTFLVTGKFFVLFSFVFGYGFSILLKSTEKKGGNIRRIYHRRLLGLLVIGMIHAVFLFEGDILVTYSILGVFLYLIRDSESSWKKWIFGFWFLSLVCYTLIGFAAYYGFSEKGELAKKLTDQAIINHLGSFSMNTNQQLIDLQFSYPFILLFNFPTAAFLFIIGLWAGKKEILSSPERIWNLFQGKKRYLFIIGLISNAGYVISTFHVNSFYLGVLPSGLLAFGGISFGILYLLLIIRYIFLTDLQNTAMVRWISNAGSISLSNYILQSILCSFIFDGWGLGYYSALHPLSVLLLTIPIYFINLSFSTLIKKYNLPGPLEWILRTWTYS